MPFATRLTLSVTALLAVTLVSPTHAQESDPAPSRAAVARAALADADWEAIEPGLSVLRGATEAGLAMTAFRISPETFSFAVAEQRRPEGERVEAFGEREGAVLAVNGGFFGEQNDNGYLFPVGLLRLADEDRSEAWQKAGGFLVLAERGPSIRPSAEGPGEAGNILQSKPLLIEPGGKWAMNTNQPNWRKRNIVCLTDDDDVILFIVTRGGISLYEAGWLMRAPELGGFFDCDAALALDGGGSTQLWFAGREDVSLRGETAVHNALVVKRR